MKKPPRQCQAIAPITTYTPEHRCLKRSGVHKDGALYLCAHHRAASARARA